MSGSNGDSNRWASLITVGGCTKSQKVKNHLEPMLEEDLVAVQNMWEAEEPAQYPDEEFSIITGNGEMVYVGRYPKGVVLRLADDPEKLVILTTGMADWLAAALGRKRNEK